jgi:hypothetical protein
VWVTLRRAFLQAKSALQRLFSNWQEGLSAATHSKAAAMCPKFWILTCIQGYVPVAPAAEHSLPSESVFLSCDSGRLTEAQAP